MYLFSNSNSKSIPLKNGWFFISYLLLIPIRWEGSGFSNYYKINEYEYLVKLL